MRQTIEYKRKGAYYSVGQRGKLDGVEIVNIDIDPPREKGRYWRVSDGEVQRGIRILTVRSFMKQKVNHGAAWIEVPEKDIPELIKCLKKAISK